MQILRRPEWLKKKIVFSQEQSTSRLLKEKGLNTVCQQAKCPNIGECFANNQATFLILGKHCTRQCAFCNVEKAQPQALDSQEPERVASAVNAMRLKHAVVTSVTRDDLPDGGAMHFARTVLAIKERCPGVTIEILVPDFAGNSQAILIAAESKPEILGHNIETVPRLYHLRPRAQYARSLHLLRTVKKTFKNIKTKSSLILGLGEKENETLQSMEDLKNVGCDFLALGQYLRPSLKHAEVVEYITPEQFDAYKKAGLKMGFEHVEAAPYVRSSYNSHQYLK